jgi:GT2 family glycosyltransferase
VQRGHAGARDDARVVTGRVLPGGDGEGHVPSTVTSTTPRDYESPLSGSVLYPNNMALSAAAAQALGGFDERFTAAAEDNDFCYRWLSAGGIVAYDPGMVVWHHDWRSPQELRRLYRRYWRAQGAFYAKHLRLGDRVVLRFVGWDLRQGLRAGLAGAVRRTPAWTDERRGALTGLPIGLVSGWRAMAPGGRARR